MRRGDGRRDGRPGRGSGVRRRTGGGGGRRSAAGAPGGTATRGDRTARRPGAATATGGTVGPRNTVRPREPVGRRDPAGPREPVGPGGRAGPGDPVRPVDRACSGGSPGPEDSGRPRAARLPGTREGRSRLRRLPGLRPARGGPHRRVQPVAGRPRAACRPHLSARRPLEQHRGPPRVPRRVGGLAQTPRRPDARPQRAHAGAQRGGRPRRRGAGAAEAGRRRAVRSPLPRPGRAAGRAAGTGHGAGARLGDERHHLHPSLRPGPGVLEEVLEQDRHHHAFGAGPGVPVRLHAEPRKGRRRLDGVLPRGRRGRHRRHGFLRPAGRNVVRRTGE
ncbi:hypothetical protein SGLAM104S_08279 [Streptomyces glaucescens]